LRDRGRERLFFFHAAIPPRKSRPVFYVAASWSMSLTGLGPLHRSGRVSIANTRSFVKDGQEQLQRLRGGLPPVLPAAAAEVESLDPRPLRAGHADEGQADRLPAAVRLWTGDP